MPLLDAIAIAGKDVTVDALLTQREFATYVVEKRKAHYYFTVKGNQPSLLEALDFQFRDRGEPHFVEHTPPDHGRIETRKIWTTEELNTYLDFPYVRQAFVIERHSTNKKTGKPSLDICYGITSRTVAQASPKRVLQANRGHWAIESCRTSRKERRLICSVGGKTHRGKSQTPRSLDRGGEGNQIPRLLTKPSSGW